VADVISRAGIHPAPADQEHGEDLQRVREGDAPRMEGSSAEAFAAAMAA
jgi:hypothetical protein